MSPTHAELGRSFHERIIRERKFWFRIYWEGFSFISGMSSGKCPIHQQLFKILQKGINIHFLNYITRENLETLLTWSNQYGCSSVPATTNEVSALCAMTRESASHVLQFDKRRHSQIYCCTHGQSVHGTSSVVGSWTLVREWRRQKSWNRVNLQDCVECCCLLKRANDSVEARTLSE